MKKIKKLRAHQVESENKAREVAEGGWVGKSGNKFLSAWVTPGGGKTLLAIIVAHVLIRAGFVDRLCWVCPRLSLAHQAEKDFVVEYDGDSFSVRYADNTEPFVRDSARGYTTTYQAVGKAAGNAHLEEFYRHRYLLVLDEPHHLCDDEARGWIQRVRPLVDRAQFVLLMSGTLERGDRRRIPFVPYTEDGRPDADIKYTRGEALEEQAIIPVEFHYHDGWVRFQDGGKERTLVISDATAEEDARHAITTFLSQTSYQNALIDKGMVHWFAYAQHYPSRMIVICDDQKMAKRVNQHIRDKYEVPTVLAISDEPQAHRAISSFRERRMGKILITVGMAYEGLDVKDCTHLIYLTATRTKPWIEQAFARVTRFDPDCGLSWSKQWAHVFVPDDPLMTRIVEQLKAEQVEGLRRVFGSRQPRDVGDDRGCASDFVPLAAELDGDRRGTWDADVPPSVTLELAKLREEFPGFVAVPSVELARAVNAIKASVTDGADVASHSESECALRKSAQVVAAMVDEKLGWEPGAANKRVRRHFGKSREHMGVAELKRAIAFLELMLTAETAE